MTTWEKFFSIVAMMTGIAIYFGMLLGGLTSILTNLDQNRARYVHRFNVVQDEIVSAVELFKKLTHLDLKIEILFYI